MKKKILLIIICLLTLAPNTKASIVEIPVTFTLVDDFYSSIEKTYENNTVIFEYTNNLLTTDLTTAQLKKILGQKSGSGSSRLTYYETLNINVKPVPNTPFASLTNKTEFYRANGGGSWVSDISPNQDAEDVAEIKKLNNDFWPWGFKIQYRQNTDEEFTSAVPLNKDLTNKSLEQQLATVLNIDLATNPDGIIDQYKTLWRFNPLPEGYNFLIRFDFYDQKDDTLPTLKQGSTTEYLVDSLKPLDTKYVVIKYNRSEETTTSLEVFKDNNNKKNFLIPLIVSIPAALIIIYFYLKLRKNN